MPRKSVIKKSALVPTALIAGGAGFIGSHLCEALLAKGARVVVLDNFKTGKEIHVKHLLTNKNFALYDVDINEGLPPEIQSVDYVVHLAGLEEYLFSKEYTDLNSLLTNALGTKNLLDLAHKSDAKFLLASSIDVYEGRMSQSELSQYFGKNRIDENKYMVTEAKRYAEALVWEYYKKNATNVRIVRLGEVYGPRMSLEASGSLGELLKNLVEKHSLVVEGDGLDKSYYLYIADAIAGVLKALFTDGTNGNIYSLVDTHPYSTLEIAYVLKGLADGGIDIRFASVSSDSGDFKPSGIHNVDVSNLVELGWGPKVSIKDGLLKSLTSLGYSTNEFSFKPGKLIVEKRNKKIGTSINVVNSSAPVVEENLFSLQDVKAKPEQKQPVVTPPVSNEIPVEMTRIVKPMPSIRKPLFNLNLPKFQFPKLPFDSRYITLPLAIVLPVMVLFIALPAFQTYTQAKHGIAYMKQAAQIDAEDIKTNSKDAYTSFYNAKKNFAQLRWVFNITGKKATYQSMDSLLASLAYLSKASYATSLALKPMESLWDVVRPDTQAVIDAASFDEAKNQIISAKNSMQLAQAGYKYVDPKALPGSIKSQLPEYENALNKATYALDMSLPLVSSLPNVLGVDQPKKYLILFQNSNEIRPTGGFVGSYGILALEKGKIKDLVIDDVYNPDGQIDLRGIKIPAPKQIASYLKEPNLHIRNANWDPDFTVSANTIQDLYFRLNGEKLDGVIAVDLSFVQSLLRVTGPIFLTAYNEEITADNLYERAEMHSEFNYKEGSDQKRTFLTVLGSKLLERLFGLNKEQLPALLKELGSSLEQRHLMIYFTNNSLSAFVNQQGWDGSLVSTGNDYFSVINANLGGTKANYYIKNKINYQITSQTRDGVLRAVATMEYNHTGLDSAWPSGPYTDYVRVLTQQGAKLTGATIKVDDKPEEDIFKKIELDNVGKYGSFGYGFVLQPKQKIVLSISYDLPLSLNISKEHKDYSLYWQKQAGTQNDVFEFSFQPPFGLGILGMSSDLQNTNNILSTNGTLNSDRSFYVKLQ